MQKGEIFGIIRTANQMLLSTIFSPDGQHVLSGSEDGILRVWNISVIGDTYKRNAARDEVQVDRVALSGDGKRVLILPAVILLYEILKMETRFAR